MAKDTVLIVDDEADVRGSVNVALTGAGYEVIEAEDGEQALGGDQESIGRQTRT